MPQTVLITGVAGFLGRYVAREFARARWRIRGIDDVPPENAPHGVDFLRLRLPNPALEEWIAKAPPDACIHAAGRASVAFSFHDLRADFHDSVVLTFSLLETFRRVAPGCRFVLLSSAAVYGNPASLPVRETDQIAPLSPYGWHKRHCELLVEQFYALYGFPGIAVRIFSAYGPGLRRQVIWDICEKALTGGTLLLHGNGAESRDFIHASDIAKALFCLVEKAAFQAGVYNVGTGTETHIDELAATIVSLLGLAIRPEFDGRRTTGDPTNWRADIGRLSALGFKPTISLEHGLRDVTAWASAELGR